MTWFYCWHRSWLDCVRGRNRRDFSVGDRIWLDFSVGIRIDLVLCGGRQWLGSEPGSKLTWFSCRGACQIDLFLEWVSKITWLQWCGRNKLGFVCGSKITWFRVWIEINLVFVSGAVQNYHAFRVGIEIDLTSLLGSKLSWSPSWGSNLTWFQRSD